MNRKGTLFRVLFRCRQSRPLSRNQDFDLLKQKNKQTGSIGLKALKPAVFLVGNEFRLRIPFGKLLTAQEGAAGEACFA